ncbi:MAG: hypothetical protein CMO55_05815 [Verrucomicrobiales bacterium]|nr:hypothetical protein [Verrucomicrobiales bacterium]
MKSIGVRFIVLLAFLPMASSSDEATRPRPAWTSTLQCLAPLAQKAREGDKPLDFDQAFFDGPFGVPQESSDYIQQGFAQLFAFDDREAERCFRFSVYNVPTNPLPWIGLALANQNSPRRSSYFLAEAQQRSEKGSPEVQALLAILPESFPTTSSDFLSDLHSVSENHNAPILHGIHARERVLATLRQADKSQTTKPDWIPSPFPLPYRMPVPLLLSAEASQSQDLAPVIQSIEAELERLDRMGSVMPDASINLGTSVALLLHQLTIEGHHAEVASLASQFLNFPRDPYSVGNRWRSLTRENALWPSARRELAGSLIAQRKWEALADLPRGFEDRDKAEWYAWQVLASIETQGNFNPWLAALRRIPETEDLVSLLENFLEVKEAHLTADRQTALDLPSLPGISDFSIGSSANSPDPVTVPSFTAPTRPARAFTLPDWEKNPISLDHYTGRPVVVIFFLGGGCLHCVEQLTAFGPWAEKFRAAGVEIVSISTDPVDVLIQTLSDDVERTKSFPIPIASDSEHTVFRQWKVFDEFDERPLHGTFLIDAEGNIIWEEKGNTPYMHPDFLLHEAQRLLTR